MIAGGGYGYWKYNLESLQKKLGEMSTMIPMLMERHDLDGVMVHGSSGVWLGSALVMFEVLPKGVGLFIVRKPGENSHGEIVEGNGIECTRLLMIDDFVSSGESVRRAQHLIIGNKVRPAYIAAVYQHERAYSGKDYSKPSYTRDHELGNYDVY